jgi:hypothetical protein
VFEKLPKEMEVDMAELPKIEVMPPRRSLIDFIPRKLRGWLRDKYRWPNFSKYETWCVHSWLLRVMSNKLLVASSKKNDSFHHVVGRDYEPGKGGWN